MKGSRVVVVVAAVAVGAWAAVGAARSESHAEMKETIFATVESAEFAEVVPGVFKAVLWGDHENGPYGTFTRFAPGVDAGMHSHSNDVWLTVFEGAYVYRDEDGEKRVGPASFILVPAGKKHWSGGDAEQGALFYEESSGGFDLVPAE